MSGTFRLPWLVLLLTVGLIAVGITFIYSGTTGTHLDGLAARQALSAGMALPLLLLVACVPPAKLSRSAGFLFVAMLGGLVAVLFVGIEINYARRWFQGPAGFLIQPSELAKPVFVLVVARFLTLRGEARRLGTLLGLVAIIALPFLLIRAQPDLGTALIFVPVVAGMAFTAGARRTWYLVALVIGLVGASALYQSPLLEDYQKERVRTFLVSIPERTAQAQEARRDGEYRRASAIEYEIQEIKRNAGYQSHIAQTSIGSGGWFGKGLGQGPQNRLRTLPERHNDFIFSVIAEETGWVGCAALLAGYLLLGVAILQVASATRDSFGRLICVGAALFLNTQAFANVAMNTGLLPITGMPLPFVSQGGSSMMSSLALVGMVVAVARTRHFDEPFSYTTGPLPDPFGFRAVDASRKRLRFH